MVWRVCLAVLVVACSAPAAEARVSVTAVKDPVRQVQAGERLRVQFTVRNSARATAKATTARVALVRGRRVTALTSGRVPRIGARKSRRLTVNAVAPARAGTYRVRVCIGRACKQSRRSVRVIVPVLPAPPPPPAPEPAPPPPAPPPAPADTTPPAPPKLAVSGLESAALTGATLHYRVGGNGRFTVTASVDPDVTRVEFARLGAGWTGGGIDATAPFTATYAFSLLSGAPGPLTAVAYDAAGNASAPARLTLAGDGTAPALEIVCDPDDCIGQVALRATDAGSGVAAILYSLDGSEPTAPYGTPFLALTETPLRARAVDRVGNVGPELVRTVGAPPAQFPFRFGEGVNAAGDDDAQTAWFRPGAAGSLRVAADEVDDPMWPALGPGWTVAPDADGALYSFTAAAAPPLIVTVSADDGARRSFFRLRHDGAPPTAPAIECACDEPSTVGVEIRLSAADGDSGVGEILYSLDGGEPTTVYTGPFKAYASGVLRARARDRVGNLGPIATQALAIDVSGDQTPPSTPQLRFTPLQGTSAQDDVVTFDPESAQSFVLQAGAEDPESGIAAITYPDLPGWTRSPTPGGVIYQRGPSAEESGPHVVTATNHAGRTSEATFRLVSA